MCGYVRRSKTDSTWNRLAGTEGTFKEAMKEFKQGVRLQSIIRILLFFFVNS